MHIHVCSVQWWWKGPSMEYAFGKSLFGRKLHYAERLMFDKSRQGAHIAFNISNIENWKSGANACWQILKTSKNLWKERDRQKNVQGFQKWIIDSTESFFWQQTNCWVENTFLISPLVCNIKIVLVYRERKSKTKIRNNPPDLTFKASFGKIFLNS